MKDMVSGKVWLVGAGPGDAGLLTQKGAQVLRKADVIIYDALVSLEILCSLPVSAQKIYVGKRAGAHTMPQEEINQCILEEALAGKQVVRLKGGDPFVFGRGGEELELLQQHRIPYEVVPGITSAIAAPAYAGIPVTHREYTSSFHVITGHARKGGEDRVDYAALARMDATLIFLMGVGQLSRISQRLIEAGMHPDTPAAIIENGTMPVQRQLLSTIQALPEEAAKEKYQAPSVILVGKTAGLMNAFQWLKTQPLFGKQCIVTRPAESGAALAEILREKGAHVILLPMLEIRRKEESREDLAAALQNMTTNFFAENWIVLSSPHDVEVFFELFAESPYDMRDLGRRVHWAVVGKRTAQTLRRYGIQADLIPKMAYGEALAGELRRRIGLSSKVYVFKGNLAGSEVYDAMTGCGVPCEELVIYETLAASEAEFAERILEEAGRPYTYTTFTSASCVEGFVQSMGRKQDYSAVKALCIGQKTAERAAAYGMQVLVAREPSIASMVEFLETQV